MQKSKTQAESTDRVWGLGEHAERQKYMQKVLTKADLILTTNKLHLLHESNENIRKNKAFNTIKIEQTSDLNLKRCIV